MGRSSQTSDSRRHLHFRQCEDPSYLLWPFAWCVGCIRGCLQASRSGYVRDWKRNINIHYVPSFSLIICFVFFFLFASPSLTFPIGKPVAAIITGACGSPDQPAAFAKISGTLKEIIHFSILSIFLSFIIRCIFFFFFLTLLQNNGTTQHCLR